MCQFLQKNVQFKNKNSFCSKKYSLKRLISRHNEQHRHFQGRNTKEKFISKTLRQIYVGSGSEKNNSDPLNTAQKGTDPQNTEFFWLPKTTGPGRDGQRRGGGGRGR
jgi:hypothetical protein